MSMNGHSYPVVQGVPVLLTASDDPTLWVANASLNSAYGEKKHWYLETLGITPEQLSLLRNHIAETNELPQTEQIDPVVSFLVGATCGHLYTSEIGKIQVLPTTQIPLPVNENNKLLIDVGCGWGRWSFAAARKGYRVIGIDPSLGAVLAAKRTAKKLGLDIDFVVADARVLPFGTNTFDTVYSYSVLQHFSKNHFIQALSDLARCAKPDAEVVIQLPNKFGIRNLYHQAKRMFRPAIGFDVRYYSPAQLRGIFQEHFGNPNFSVDGFFGLNIQPSDMEMMSTPKKAVIQMSSALKFLSNWIPGSYYLADSLFLSASKTKK